MQLRGGLGVAVPQEMIIYRRCYRPLVDDISVIRRYVGERDISLVIIDSAAVACGGSPESTEPTLSFFGALKNIGTASLTIAHEPKKRQKMPMGSVHWHNAPRSVLRLTSSQIAGTNTSIITLTQTKKNWGRNMDQLSFEVSFDEEAVTYERLEIGRNPRKSEKSTISDRIAEVLQDGDSTTGEIADQIDENFGSVKTVLNRKKLLFERVAGSWRLRNSQI